MHDSKKTFGVILLHIALAILFIVDGINVVFYGRESLGVIFGNGELGNILSMALGIVELVSGVILFLQMIIPVGAKLNACLMFIIIIAIVALIIVQDILGSKGLLGGNIFSSRNAFFSFVQTLAYHLLMLGAVIIVK